ncbi:hypothetical protein EG68_02454 [Paragonimus skrjabini miyazakii]|uniref:L-asparaginase N-terminal domain-containing protein n=1 Tax=Paragonimus skrjabini miyazakii TaxID=59628 RepID=A0A8S9Z364_9TREM|nr:hypothetical protein EG68_02454 [Paragonimus skrjabini miyazakii]
MDILIIQTGGTIDKCYPRHVGGYAFEFGESYANKLIKEHTLPNNVLLHCLNPFSKDSLEVTESDRWQLIEIINETSIHKILITHGTDTILETAQFLSSNLGGNDTKCVVLTGSFLPGVFKSTDADFNVGFALGGLLHTEKTGVFIAIQGRFFRSNEVTRNSETGDYQEILGEKNRFL